MDNLFGLLFLLSIVALIIGMVKPELVIRWGNVEKRKRKSVALIYGIGALVFLILIGVTTDTTDKSIQASNKKEVETLAEETTTKEPVTQEITTRQETTTQQQTTVQVTTTAPIQMSEPTAAADTTEVTVHITKTGDKYHREGCQYLSRSDIPIDLSNAKARGYTPCSVCNPPQ